jgi:hypothetical protein
MPKKTARQLNHEIARALSKPLLREDWPDAARRYVKEAAARLNLHENLDRAVDEVMRSLESDQARGVGDFYIEGRPIADSWYARFESGALENEIRDALRTAQHRPL